jgi:multidrug efflux pump subunit AcrA (membrane-fusion protein)
MRKLQKSTKIFIYCGVAVVLIAAVIFFFRNGNNKQTVSVIRADIVAEVAATGKVKPAQSVDLGFDKSGRIENVYVLIGDTVKKGQTIANLESGEVSADLAKAKASLLGQEITLRELRNTAPISYNDAVKNLDAAVREGFADADNAVRNRADQFFKNTQNNPQFEISITSGNFIHYFTVPNDLALEINSERKNVEIILINWQKRISSMKSSNLVAEADNAIGDLNIISDFLDKMAEAVNSFTSADYVYDTTVNAYKTTISGARSDISGAVSSIVVAKGKLTAAPSIGENGQFDNISIQEAVVAQAEATVTSLEASLSKSAIRAPFDGIVILQDAKMGATVSAGKTLVSVVSKDEMYIEANISEIHIGKIALDNPASVTFDAFPGEEFSGSISYIEPGDVIIDGIVNYKIRVSLANADVRIKNGLTANLKIQTAKKGNVLSLPLYAIIKENSQNFVNKIVDRKIQKIPVILGLSGSNGMVEILSGLSIGDMVEF